MNIIISWIFIAAIIVIFSLYNRCTTSVNCRSQVIVTNETIRGRTCDYRLMHFMLQNMQLIRAVHFLLQNMQLIRAVH